MVKSPPTQSRPVAASYAEANSPPAELNRGPHPVTVPDARSTAKPFLRVTGSAQFVVAVRPPRQTRAKWPPATSVDPARVTVWTSPSVCHGVRASVPSRRYVARRPPPPAPATATTEESTAIPRTGKAGRGRNVGSTAPLVGSRAARWVAAGSPPTLAKSPPT
ncbi:hypothetical protein GCM10009814_00170 [Lapillicoccus jejuensis]